MKFENAIVYAFFITILIAGVRVTYQTINSEFFSLNTYYGVFLIIFSIAVLFFLKRTKR